MTISTTISKVVLPGTGAQTSFAYPFLIPALGDEQVIYTDGNGNSTILTESQYTITGIGSSTGGTVTYTISGAAIAIGTSLTIARNVPYVQSYSFNNQGYFLPSVIESAFDYVTMALQQIENSSVYAFSAPTSDANPPLPLPSASARALKYAAFDGNGNMIAALPASATAPVSAAMQPVVAAATTAAAVSLLGINTTNGGFGSSTSIAVASTVDLGTSATHNVLLTGSGTIASFGSSASAAAPDYQFQVSAATTFVNSANLICPGGVNLSGAAGDIGIAVYQGSGIWRLNAYFPASGNSPVAPNITPSTGLPAATGLVIKNNSGSNTVLAVTAAFVQIPNSSFVNIIRQNISVTVNTANLGAGGLDAGTVAASTWYYVWLIDNGATTSAIMSLSATTPTLPSGYTYSMRIGAVYTNASKQLLQTLQVGNRTQYVVAASTTVPNLPVIISTTTNNTSYVAFSLATFVPPTAVRATFVLTGDNVGTAWIAPNAQYGTATSTTNPPPFAITCGVAGAWAGVASMSCDMILESYNVYFARNGANTVGLFAAGWTDSINAT